MARIGNELDDACFQGTIQTCCRASKWEHALNVLADMRHLEVEPDAVCLNTVIDSMLDAEFAGALALYRAQMDGSNVGVATSRKDGMDLHGLTGELARLAVRVKLLDIAIALTSTSSEIWRHPEEHGLQADGSLQLIVGLGQHSRTGESILGPSLLQMLEQELGLRAHFHPQSESVLQIPKHELLQLINFPEGFSNYSSQGEVGKKWRAQFMSFIRLVAEM